MNSQLLSVLSHPSPALYNQILTTTTARNAVARSNFKLPSLRTRPLLQKSPCGLRPSVRRCAHPPQIQLLLFSPTQDPESSLRQSLRAPFNPSARSIRPVRRKARCRTRHRCSQVCLRSQME